MHQLPMHRHQSPMHMHQSCTSHPCTCTCHQPYACNRARSTHTSITNAHAPYHALITHAQCTNPSPISHSHARTLHQSVMHMHQPWTNQSCTNHTPSSHAPCTGSCSDHIVSVPHYYLSLYRLWSLLFTDWLWRRLYSFAEVFFFFFAEKSLLSGVKIFVSRFVSKNKWDILAFFFWYFG